MASKIKCHCGRVLRTNLYEGHGLSLLVPEELTDRAEPNESAGGVLDQIVAQSSVVIACPNCKGITIQAPNGTFLSYGLLSN